MIPHPEENLSTAQLLQAEIRSLPKFAQKWLRPGKPRYFNADQLRVLRRLLAARPTLATHVTLTPALDPKAK